MCTLSLVPSRDGSALSVLMNRDEGRLRPAARPPSVVNADGVEVVRPTDSPSGGTWIAATDAGIVYALLNGSGPRTAADGPSRGSIIPALWSSRTLDEVASRWATLDLTAVAPCTLVAATLTQVATLDHHGTPAPRRPGVFDFKHPRVFSSSSLGDELVRGPRLVLFDQLMAQASDPWEWQRRFHQHAWPNRRHLSVLMSRRDACTVSRTEIRLAAARVDMRYASIVDGWPAGVVSPDLVLRVRPAIKAA